VTTTAHRPPNAPPLDTPARRRTKLAIMLAVLIPMAAFGAFHMVRGVKMMMEGKPVGYEQRDHRVERVPE
jgi:hypothetical protein